MSSYRFSQAERFTVFTADGGKCFWCGVPLFYRDVQIDHVFPERLEDDAAEFDEVRRNYGLGDAFDINGFGNWVTCHQGCNLRKRGELLPNAPMTVFIVQLLNVRAPKLVAFRRKLEKDVKRSRILGLIESAIEAGEITQSDVAGFFDDLPPVPVATSEKTATIQLTKDLQLIVQSSPAAQAIAQGWKLAHVSGDIAYVHNDRVGGRVPNLEDPHPSWQCSNCGNYGPWDGIICRSCGNREEAD